MFSEIEVQVSETVPAPGPNRLAHLFWSLDSSSRNLASSSWDGQEGK